MSKTGRFILKVVPLLLALVLAAAAIISVFSAEKLVPDNPLDAPANERSISSNGSSGDNEFSDDTGVDTKDSNSDDTEEETDQAESSQNISNQQSQDSIQSGNIPPQTSAAARPQSSVKNSSSYGNNGSDSAGSKGHYPSGAKTYSTYFTTSIKDGETVHSLEYSFTVEHLHKELPVLSETYYVNGGRQSLFRGAVLLSEGKNTLRISVQYRMSDGKTVSVYSDYTVYADLGDIVISTDLTDGMTVDTDRIDFSASASRTGRSLPVMVTVNGAQASGEENFTALLISGENNIAISASDGSAHAEKNFRIICTVPAELYIYTDLSDGFTVHSEILEFTARVLNGSDRARLTVVVNGETIEGGDKYVANLSVGDNIIRLKATDRVNGEKITVDRSFIVKMVPLADEKTAPRISYINVSDGMNIVGSEFILDISPVDYLGERIYYNGISVVLNGLEYRYKWASEYTSYLLWFADGENRLDIRITDRDGRFSEYSYTVYCRVPQDGEKKGELTFCMDANVLGLGYLIEPQKVDIIQGESGADLLLRVLRDNGFECDQTGSTVEGFYVARVRKNGIAVGVNIPDKLKAYIDADGLEWKPQHFDDSLGEFDYCQGSGWMYCINESYVNFGYSDAVFKDGDYVRMRFTLAYGKDIGGFESTGGAGKNYDRTW